MGTQLSAAGVIMPRIPIGRREGALELRLTPRRERRLLGGYKPCGSKVGSTSSPQTSIAVRALVRRRGHCSGRAPKSGSSLMS